MLERKPIVGQPGHLFCVMKPLVPYRYGFPVALRATEHVSYTWSTYRGDTPHISLNSDCWHYIDQSVPVRLWLHLGFTPRHIGTYIGISTLSFIPLTIVLYTKSHGYGIHMWGYPRLVMRTTLL